MAGKSESEDQHRAVEVVGGRAITVPTGPSDSADRTRETTTRTMGFECSSGDWVEGSWTGVNVADLVEAAGMPDDTTHLVVECDDGYRGCVAIDACPDGLRALTGEVDPVASDRDTIDRDEHGQTVVLGRHPVDRLLAVVIEHQSTLDGGSSVPEDRFVLVESSRGPVLELHLHLTRLGSSDVVDRVDTFPAAKLNRIVATFDDSLYPTPVSAARLELRLRLNDHINSSYIEDWAGDRWECRWDRHDNDHNTREHFHPPPTVTTATAMDIDLPADPNRAVEIVLRFVEDRIRALWQTDELTFPSDYEFRREYGPDIWR